MRQAATTDTFGDVEAAFAAGIDSVVLAGGFDVGLAVAPGHHLHRYRFPRSLEVGKWGGFVAGGKARLSAWKARRF